MQAQWNQQLKNWCLNWIQASKGLFASTVTLFSYQELQQESESDGEERDTLWLHAWNVRPSKGISVDLTMFCGVKNTIPPSSKIMTMMRLCKKIKRKDRRRVNDCQSWEKEKGHSPFFYCKVGEDFLSGGAERFFDQQNWTGQVLSFCIEFTFFLFRAYILKCAWTEANNWIIYNGICF